VSLVNFSVPLSWVASEVFDTIRKNAILATALLHPDLPGMRDTVKSWITKPRLRRRNVDPVELDYASAISGLSHIGNSPASVRTKLSWCAYRIRHLQTIGKAERFILGAYRLIGYGEWPMPAFILYFFFALSMAMVYLYLSGESLTLTVAGIKHRLARESPSSLEFNWRERRRCPFRRAIGHLGPTSDRSAFCDRCACPSKVR
jgi:hypothetical protein